jgi:hypothetical protein
MLAPKRRCAHFVSSRDTAAGRRSSKTAPERGPERPPRASAVILAERIAPFLSNKINARPAAPCAGWRDGPSGRSTRAPDARRRARRSRRAAFGLATRRAEMAGSGDKFPDWRRTFAVPQTCRESTASASNLLAIRRSPTPKPAPDVPKLSKYPVPFPDRREFVVADRAACRLLWGCGQ